MGVWTRGGHRGRWLLWLCGISGDRRDDVYGLP
jgi:hypothetical protein